MLSSRRNKQQLTVIVRSLMFLLKYELFKENIVGRHVRYEFVFERYLKTRLSKKLLIFIIQTAPTLWIMLSICTHIVINRTRFVNVSDSSLLFLDHPSHKFQLNFSEEINELQKHRLKSSLAVADIILTLPFLIIVVSKIINKRRSYNPEIACKFIFSYLRAMAYLRVHREIRKVVINDDFMPNDLAILAAAANLGLFTGAFRVNDAFERSIPPFWIDELYCLDQRQSTEFSRSRKARVASKNITCVNVNRLSNIGNLRVCHPLTSKFEANQVMKVLSSISCELPIRFLIKLHPEPRSDNVADELMHISKKFNLNVEIIEGKVPIEQLYGHIDVCLGGNSSACKDLLNLGIPVLYRNDMDLAEFDAHGWLKSRYFYDFREESIIDLKKITNFYGNTRECLYPLNGN